MKPVGVISTAVLSLVLGVGAPLLAQEQHEEEQKKPEKQEQKQAQPEKAAKQEQKPSAQQEKNSKPEEKNAKQEERNAKPAGKSAHQEQHANNGGGRIPADKFKANFGRQHTFRVSQSDYSNHRFQYGGYSFGFVDPWPSNWLYTQNVYVVEINGVYYLCNPMFPGVNLALSFSL
ncbi:MAG: hypothetical protein WBS24_10455 [Terriglobales bacterium]